MTQSFNWRDYITLRESNPVLRAQFEVMLDRIASTRDGQELITRAKLVSGSVEVGSSLSQMTLGGQPFRVRQDSMYAKGAALVVRNPSGQYEGKATVALDNPERRAAETSRGTTRIVTHTETLVHELYHLADPNHLPHIRLMGFREAIREEIALELRFEGVSEEARAAAIERTVDTIMERIGAGAQSASGDADPSKIELVNIEAAFSEVWRRGMRRDPEFLESLRRESGATSVTTSSAQLKEALVRGEKVGFNRLKQAVVGESHNLCCGNGTGEERSGAPGAGEAATYEEQAVRYTDAFMLNNFGIRDPIRYYGNTQKPSGPDASTPPEEPVVTPFTGNPENIPRYEPQLPPPGENLPSPPRVLPHQASAAQIPLPPR